jgi:hypothetical protein
VVVPENENTNVQATLAVIVDNQMHTVLSDGICRAKACLGSTLFAVVVQTRHWFHANHNYKKTATARVAATLKIIV